jgi:hypothetical protein
MVLLPDGVPIVSYYSSLDEDLKIATPPIP